MADHQIVETVVENESQSTSEVPSSSPEQDQEAAEVTQDRAENGQFRRRGGYLRKIEKLERERDHFARLALGRGTVEPREDMSPDEWRKVRDAQVRNGGSYTPSAPADVEDEPVKAAEEKGALEAENQPPDAPLDLSPEEIEHFEQHDSFIQRAGAKLVTAAALEEVDERRSPAKPPAPINPVRKVAATATGLSDDLPVDEWRRRRERQVEKQRGR